MSDNSMYEDSYKRISLVCKRYILMVSIDQQVLEIIPSYFGVREVKQQYEHSSCTQSTD